MPFLDKTGLEHLSGIIKEKYAGKDSNGAVVSVGADYAEYGDWDDGNPNGDDRKGYFITIVNGTDNIAIAESDSAIIGVTTTTAGFIGNYSDGSETNGARGLVGIVGQVSVIDNGTCTVGERCMPNDEGTAEPSTNTCGYKVIDRIDDTHVKILISPTIDMIQRIRTDMVNVQSDVDALQSSVSTNTKNISTNATNIATNTKNISTNATNIATNTKNISTNATNISKVWQKIYPVGAVYISYVSTSPASLFGGTWKAITGAFPYFNAGTATGGSNTHTLTVAQMPSHNHVDSTSAPIMAIASSVTSGGAGCSYDLTTVGQAGIVANSKNTKLTKYVTKAGDGEAHNNMPAYQTLYAWRRTA